MTQDYRGGRGGGSIFLTLGLSNEVIMNCTAVILPL